MFCKIIIYMHSRVLENIAILYNDILLFIHMNLSCSILSYPLVINKINLVLNNQLIIPTSTPQNYTIITELLHSSSSFFGMSGGTT